MTRRRDRLRAEMFATLRRVGADELRRVGAAHLSLREVAEQAGISPAGLYRYVDGRDALLELLIADAFDDLAGAVLAAIGDDDGDDRRRIRALGAAYRTWAAAEPERFALILGSPVVGFHSSEDGPTRPAAQRFGVAMLRPFLDACERGAIAPGEGPDVAVGPDGEHLAADVLARVIRGWGAIHGLVMLDLDGQLDWAGLDLADLVDAETEALSDDLVPAR